MIDSREDRKDIIPHFFYKKECNGHLRCVSMRLDETVGLKYIWKCDKCGEEIELDFDKLYEIIY